MPGRVHFARNGSAGDWRDAAVDKGGRPGKPTKVGLSGNQPGQPDKDSENTVLAVFGDRGRKARTESVRKKGWNHT